MIKKSREMFVAAAKLSIVRSLCGGKVELYASEDCKVVAGFVGKRAKPSMYYRFSSVEKAAEYADKWVSEEAEKIEKSAAANAAVKVGDLFVSSWGWEQTNVDFYSVVAVSGSMVSLKALKAKKVYSSDMAGKSFPKVGEFASDVVIRRKLLSGGSRATVKINSCAFADCVDMNEVLMNGKYFSEYA